MSDGTQIKLTLTLVVLTALTVMMQCAEQPEPQRQGNSFHESMKLDQIERQLDTLDGAQARTYTVLGVETEGRYFWFCDETWVEITDFCKPRHQITT